jgi:excisionase family DNA binding protein
MGGGMAHKCCSAGENTMSDDRLMDVKEVARFLNLAPGTIYHFVSEKRLPCIRLSARCLRFRRSDLEKLIANLAETPAAR